ncbi:MAG: RNA polymerase sigma factor [Clostridia bacterium]|nr:RNA polymerase sigma factor [Clostridia bacterium]
MKSEHLEEQYLTLYTEQFMEKVFYFCLRKCGTQDAAEELAADISLNIISAIRKGQLPHYFTSWVWQIARNRYARWADAKHRRDESVSGADLADFADTLADEEPSPEDALVSREQLSLLRRELAFIGEEYRTLLVAYYHENRRIEEIARSLGIPKGTALSRLQRSRKILKEGMNMAREFGIRSYKPEDIAYSTNCAKTGSKNQPYSIMEHDLYTNILLEAYGNPSTAEALAMELGIALPYMQSELNYLTRETLLVKNGDKYETAIPIVSRSAQEQVHIAQLTIAPDLMRALGKFVERLNDAFEANGYAYYGNFQDFESAKWTLLMLAFDYFIRKNPRRHGFTARPDGGKWDIVGYQTNNIVEPYFVGNHGSGNCFQQFKYCFDGIAERTPNRLSDEDCKILRDCVCGKIDLQKKEILDTLTAYGYLRREGETYLPTVMVLRKSEIKRIAEEFDDNTRSELTALADQARELFAKLHRQISDTIKADLPARFAEDDQQYRTVVEHCYHSRGYVMAEALRSGWLKPADEVSPAIGAHLFLFDG